MSLISFTIKTPISYITISTTKTQICSIVFTNQQPSKNQIKNKFTQSVKKELKQYFLDPKHKFNIKLKLQGTKFQKKVWQILAHIPSGKTKTYGEIAKILKTSSQAVGQACKANKIIILIPCHRVVSKKKIGGYCGKTILDLVLYKEWLLKHEKAKFLWEI